LNRHTAVKGSIVACARYGNSNSPSTRFTACASAASASPTSFTVSASFPRPRARYSFMSSVVPRFSASDSSQVTLNASRPFFADHMSRPTTATPRGICTTSTTPATAFAVPASNALARAPTRGGRSAQQRARGGACLAQLLPGVGHGRGPAGELRVGPQRHEGHVLIRGNLGRCALDTYLGPGGIELFGDDSRKPGPHALPRLEVLGDHGDGVIGRDAHERHRERAGGAAGTGLRAAAGPHSDEREPGTGERSQLQELPPRQLRG